MGPKTDSASVGKRRKVMLSLELKQEIIGKHEYGVRVSDLAKLYGRNASTISTIIKQKEALKSIIPCKGITIISKRRSPTLEKMERLLLAWINEKEIAGDFSISESIICEKASTIYYDLKADGSSSTDPARPPEEFKASRGWFKKFCKRNEFFKGRNNGGEEGSSSDAMVAEAATDEFIKKRLFASLQGVEESRNEKLLKAMLYQMNPKNPQNITVPAALGKPMTLENRKVSLSTSSTSNSTLTPETIQIEDVPPPTKKPKEIQIEIDEDESNDASKSDLQSTLEPPTQKIITASSSSTSTSSSVPSAKSKPAQSVSVVNALDVNRPQKQKRILVVPNHQQSVMSNLSSLWKAGRLCDAFISNGTVNVKVHKMILGAVCPKVLDVFYNTPQHKLPKVTFPSSVSKEALLAFAEYMYNGVLDLDFDLLNQMKVIAHRLDMKDFEQLCNNQINSSLVPNMMPTILEPMLSEPCSSSGLIQGLQTTVMERVQTTNRVHTKNGLHAVSSLSTVQSAASNSGISLSSLPLVEVRAETDDNLMEVNNELGGSGGAEDSRSSRVKIEKVDLDDQAYGGEAVSSEMNFSTSDSLTANNFAMPHFPNSDLSHSSSTSSQHTNNTFNKPVSVTHVWSKKNKERANVELGSPDPYPTGLYTIDWSNLPPSTQEIKQEYSID